MVGENVWNGAMQCNVIDSFDYFWLKQTSKEQQKNANDFRFV